LMDSFFILNLSSPEIAIHKIYRYEKQRACCLQKADSNHTH